METLEDIAIGIILLIAFWLLWFVNGSVSTEYW
jgi:hypothetical protein